MDDNLFDDDDALDFILYEECEKEVNDPENKGGCFGTIIFLLISPMAGLLFLKWI